MATNTRIYYKDENIIKKLETDPYICEVYRSETSRKIHIKIFKDWIYGLTYKDLAGKYDKSVNSISKTVKSLQKRYEFIKTGKEPVDEPIVVKSKNGLTGKVREEDIKLYKFYFSDKNMKMRHVSDLDKNIYRLRFEECLTVKDIAEAVQRSESNVRVHLQAFNRVALAAYWYSKRFNNDLEDI